MLDQENDINLFLRENVISLFWVGGEIIVLYS